MDLKTYAKALKACITASPPDLGNEDSILGMLYEAYSESSAMYDDEIKADFHALYEAMHGMPLQEMDKIVYPVCTLCSACLILFSFTGLFRKPSCFAFIMAL